MKHRSKTGPTRMTSRFLVMGGAIVLTFGAPIVLPNATPLALAQSRDIGVYINEQPLTFSGARPARIGGRVMVPMRSIFEALGAQVQWDPGTQGINAQRAATVVQMQIGNRNATINGQAVTLDQPPLLYAGATMVPLRFVGEAMGAEVRWSEIQSAVFITDAQAEQPGTLPNPNPVTPPVNPNPITPPINPNPITPPVNPNPVTPTPGTPGYIPPVGVPQANTVTGIVVKVDAAPPATLTLRVRDANGTSRLAAYNVAEDARLSRVTAPIPQNGATPNFGTPVRLSYGGLAPGEEVEVQVGAGNIVTDVSATTLLAPARVRSVQNNQIVLDDGRNTTLVVGDTAQGGVRFWGAGNREVKTPDVKAGDNVALYIAPSTMTIFQISSRVSDLRATGSQPNTPTGPAYQTPGTNPGGLIPGTNPGGLIPGTDPGTFPNPNLGNPPANVPPGTPQIQSVAHTATLPLRAGQTVQVVVRANTGLRGTFTLSPRMAPQPLSERPDRPGTYVAVYNVRPGDDVLNGRVTVTMLGANNMQDVQQSQAPITIDTVPPRVTGIFPANGSQTNNTLPNIAIYADDLGGGGLARGTITLTTSTGQKIDVPAVVVVGGISGETPRALPAGQVNVNASVVDAAGNATPVISTFNVLGVNRALASVTHNARAAMRGGDVLVTELRGDANGRATFDLVGDNNRLVATNIPMREIEPGRYQGTYTVQGNEATSKMRVVGRFTGADNQPVTNEATTQVTLAAATVAQPAALSITSPARDAEVQTPLTVRGKALPGAIIDISIRAEGTQVTRLLVFESRRPFTQELGTQQVQADVNGNWVTRAIELPTAKDVEDLKFVISATQTDTLNRKSPPVTVTVTPR